MLKLKTIQFICMLSLFFLISCTSAQINQAVNSKFTSGLPRPAAQIKEISIKEISLKDITFLIKAKIINPYPLGIKLNSIKADITVENRKALSTQASRGIQINALKSSTTEFDVKLSYEFLRSLVQNYSDKEYLDTGIDLAVIIALPKMEGLPPDVTLNFRHEKKIPAIHPDVSIQNFNVKLPELNEVRQSLKTSAVTADPKDVLNMFEDIFNGQKPDLTPVKPDSLDLKFKISFDVVLKNKTKAALDFKKTEYDFYIGSEKLISGWTDKSAQNGKASIISVQNEFSSRSLAKSVIDAFKKGKGSYRFVGNTNLKLPDEYMQNTAEMKFDESGTFNLR